MKAARGRRWTWFPRKLNWRRRAAITMRPVRTISMRARIWKSRQDGEDSAKELAKGAGQAAKMAAAALRRDDGLFAFRGSAAETGGCGEGRARSDPGCAALHHRARYHLPARAGQHRGAHHGPHSKSQSP